MARWQETVRHLKTDIDTTETRNRSLIYRT